MKRRQLTGATPNGLNSLADGFATEFEVTVGPMLKLSLLNRGTGLANQIGMRAAAKLSIISALFLLCHPIMGIARPQHDRAFWKRIVDSDYRVPEHESADELASELSSLLASPDPELRDDLAYSILAHWIYSPNVLQTTTLIELTDTWRANLKDKLGEAGTNGVLKRSFSALCLASMARREARTPFMGTERFHQLVRESTDYLQAERDLRGYDATLHWIHATAHTADLLAGLARSSQLTEIEAGKILDAIAARLSSAPQVYTEGEQDRLAAAVLAVVRRPEVSEGKFEQWLAGITDEDREVWNKTTPSALARYQNHTYLLQALFARMALEKDSDRIARCKEQVLAVIKDRLD